MDALEASDSADNVTRFLRAADTLGREIDTLRKTGNPSRLPAIKEITQKLVGQATMFKLQSKAAAILGHLDQVRSSETPQGSMIDTGSISQTWLSIANKAVFTSSHILPS